MTQESQLRAEIEEQLGNVVCPCAAAEGYSSYGIDDMGLVKSIDIDDGHLTVNMRVTNPACLKVGYLKQEIDKHVGEKTAVDSISVEVDDGLEWRPDMMSDEFKEEREQRFKQSAEALEGH